MAQNLIEKIVQRHAVDINADEILHSGDYVTIRPAYVMTHDNTGAVIPKFRKIGAARFYRADQVVHTLDHNIQDRSEKNLQKYSRIEAFSKEMGAHFFPAGRGIGHQIMVEEGFAWPGTFVVASDSHSNMYGGLGCLGTPVVRTDAAAIWASGKTWWRIPPVTRVELRGRLQAGVTGKDVIIALAGYFNQDQVLNYAIEFSGEGVSGLSIDQRLTIANMTTEWGALAGLFPVDEKTISWLEERIRFVQERDGHGDPGYEHPRLNRKRLQSLLENPLLPDENASYAAEIIFYLDSVVPCVSGPDTVKKFVPVSEIAKQKIRVDKAYLVSCVNSRLEDIQAAASVLAGRKIADHVKFYVAAASSEVQEQAERLGYWQKLLQAGAIPLPPGCGPCIGLGMGLLEDDETGISATNRNFKGRMGSPKAKAYLASPAVVAASALKGYICGPQQIYPETRIEASFQPLATKSQSHQTRIIQGFPETITGEIIFCPQDNLNTDGIFPGKYTYQDDLTPEDQARVVMQNYDPQFVQLIRKGDILVSGFNFGTGSSREQAATAFKYAGIQMVIAGSFSETYKRNAINNGFIVVESPQLVAYLKGKFPANHLTIRTGLNARIDFARAFVEVEGQTFSISPFGGVAQEIIVEDGLENWVKKQLARKDQSLR